MFREAGRAEGEAKGPAEGRAEGHATGRVEAFLKLAFLTFGPLSDEIVKRIETASLEDLDHYTANILSASRVEDIFG